MRHSSYGKFLDSRKHGQFAIEFYDFFYLCGWRDSSGVKSTKWSSGGPGFDSQNSHGGS